MVNSSKPTGCAGRTSISAMFAAGGGCAFNPEQKCLQASLGAFEMNFDPFFPVQHPAIQSVGPGETIDEGRNPTPCTTPRTRMEQRASIYRVIDSSTCNRGPATD